MGSGNSCPAQPAVVQGDSNVDSSNGFHLVDLHMAGWHGGASAIVIFGVILATCYGCWRCSLHGNRVRYHDEGERGGPGVELQQVVHRPQQRETGRQFDFSAE